MSADGDGAGTPGIDPAVRAAKERGVFFDVGHGQGAFLWGCAEMAIAGGLWRTVMQQDHTNTTQGHIDVRDSISAVIVLKF